MTGTDATGAAGVEGDVDTHPWGMAGAVTGAAFFSILGQAGAIINSGNSSGTTNIGSIGAQGAGSEVQSIGNKLVSRQLDRPNTLTLKPGSRVAVLLARDVQLPAWRGTE